VAIESTIGGSGVLFVGEDKTFRLETLLPTTLLPVDVASWAILFDIRTKDTSAEYIISRLATITGVFNAVRASNTQRAVVVLTDTDLNLFRAKTYRYSWKRMDDGLETVLAYGDFAPQKATAP
jgi:hypothetical protein